MGGVVGQILKVGFVAFRDVVNMANPKEKNQDWLFCFVDYSITGLVKNLSKFWRVKNNVHVS